MMTDRVVLSGYRHLLPDFVQWTHLPDGLEQAYWSSTTTGRGILTTDTAGIAAFMIGRVLLHGYIIRKHGHCVASNINVFIHTIISILQLIWMRKRPESYLKHRTKISMFHRARNWAEWWLTERTPLGRFTHFVYPPPDSWSTLLTFATQRSLLKAMAQLNHPLPVSHLLLVSAMSLLDAMLFGPSFVRFTLPAFQLQHKTRQLCHMMHSAFTLPWSLLDTTETSAELPHCSPGYIEYVAVFAMCYQLVILLPVGPTFLLERASKAAFISSLGPRKPQCAMQLLERYRPPSWSDVLLTTWLCLSLPWMAVTMVCRLLGAAG